MRRSEMRNALRLSSCAMFIAGITNVIPCHDSCYAGTSFSNYDKRFCRIVDLQFHKFYNQTKPDWR